jgi:hypothetical protein
VGNLLVIMSNLLTAGCLAVIVGAISTASAQSQQGSGTGAYLADGYGMTCSGFVHATDAADAVRLQPSKDVLGHLIERKWGSVSREKLRRLEWELVTQCERHGRTDFETTATQVIARSGPCCRCYRRGCAYRGTAPTLTIAYPFIGALCVAI